MACNYVLEYTLHTSKSNHYSFQSLTDGCSFKLDGICKGDDG